MVCSLATGAAGAAVIPQHRTARRATVSVRPCVQPCVSLAPRHALTQQQRSVEARFFRFGKNGMGAEDAGIVGSQGRDDYDYDDLEQYFNYMGFLAEEGTYDRMEAMLKFGLHPIDAILLLAASENDTPKLGEILKAGADIRIKGLDGKTPLELATKAETRALLEEYEKKATVGV